MRRFGLYAALAMCVYGLPATAEERFERWSLEQPGDFILALSFKRSISFDDRAATSELAFLCNQEEKYVAVLLIPRHGTFKNRQSSIPVGIQKIQEQSDASDLTQRWENGPGYIFLESPDTQEELASYLKDREAKGLKSVHFYFPNDPDASTKLPITWSLTLPDFQPELRLSQIDATGAVARLSVVGHAQSSLESALSGSDVFNDW